ncbi:MAG: glycosyltransferase family 2 protein, partial [Fidelibacterota bacterium]
IALLIPCFNEVRTVGKVVKDCKRAMPTATIYVFDNNSTDGTAQAAKEAGAQIVTSPFQGKGNVVRHMFQSINADVYILIDGDDTYPVDYLEKMLAIFQRDKVDMVVGTRFEKYEKGSLRLLHRLGNRLISTLISWLFKARVTDVFSGFRILSRRFVETVYLKSNRFEVETEMTLQALMKHFTIAEVPVPYRCRPQGSHSKLNTFSDGISTIKALLFIFKDYKPFAFFTFFAFLFFILGLIAGWFPIQDYILYRYVYRVPLAILAVALEIIAVVLFGVGLILDTITNLHLENQELLKRK